MRLLSIAAFAVSAGTAFAQQSPPPAPIEPPSVYDVLADKEQALAQTHAQIAALAHEISRLKAEAAKSKSTPAPAQTPSQ